MSKKRRYRLFIHVPHGFFIALAVYVHPVLAAILAGLFIFYQRNEDHWIKDQAWKDVAGAILGLILAIALILAFRLATGRSLNG